MSLPEGTSPCQTGAKRKESPQARLERIATEVRSWPSYLRVHSSAYYEAQRRKRV